MMSVPTGFANTAKFLSNVSGHQEHVVLAVLLGRRDGQHARVTREAVLHEVTAETWYEPIWIALVADSVNPVFAASVTCLRASTVNDVVRRRQVGGDHRAINAADHADDVGLDPAGRIRRADRTARHRELLAERGHREQLLLEVLGAADVVGPCRPSPAGTRRCPHRRSRCHARSR